MGERVCVELVLLLSQKEKAEALFEYQPEDESESGTLIVYSFQEVNYGNISFLNRLRDAGIAYDSTWAAGSNWTEGTASCRFNSNGAAIEKSLSHDERNPPLALLLELIDKPAELREYILKHHEKISTLPWENQVEYGKIYLTKKLIGV